MNAVAIQIHTMDRSEGLHGGQLDTVPRSPVCVESDLIAPKAEKRCWRGAPKNGRLVNSITLTPKLADECMDGHQKQRQ